MNVKQTIGFVISIIISILATSTVLYFFEWLSGKPFDIFSYVNFYVYLLNFKEKSLIDTFMQIYLSLAMFILNVILSFLIFYIPKFLKGK
jgi:hypothetical protein